MTNKVAPALLAKSAQLESALAPSAQIHLRPYAPSGFPLRLLIAACAIERALAPVPTQSPLLRRFV